MNICGIDISKDTFDCCFLVGEKPYYKIYENDRKGFDDFLSFSYALQIEKIGYEATGNYGKKLERYLTGNGINPLTIKPLAISHFAKTLKIQGKTDKSDSYVIAFYMTKYDDILDLTYPIRDMFKPFHSTLKLLDKQKRQSKNLLHSIELYPENSPVIDSLNASIINMEVIQKEVEKQAYKMLLEMCPETEQIRNDIAGVGSGLLLYVLPLIYDHFDKFTLKQLNSFIGLNPVAFRSGTSVRKNDHVSRHGDKRTMTMLYMASVSAVRHNEILKEKYIRLKEHGKPSKVALMSIMSHLFRAIIYKLSHYSGRGIKK